MEVVCDLETGSVVLVEPDELGRFNVVVAGPAGGGTEEEVARLGDMLSGSGAGRLDAAGDVLVSQAWLRQSAAGAVAPGWDDRFEAMCRFAASKGWIDESDGSIKGHVVWPAEGATG